MPGTKTWRCARCETLNLPGADACRRCGALPGEAAPRRRETAPAPRRAGATARSDHAGLAATLSLLLPGLGQLYTGRVARATAILGWPIAIGAVSVAVLLIFDPLAALALRVAVGLAASAVVLLAMYHGAVVLDAFAAPSTRGIGLRGKTGREYAALTLCGLALAILYVTLFRQATAWAALSARVFEPFQRSGGTQGVPWSGQERLNMLLLGVDTRAGFEAEGNNTDTVIVVTVDPTNRTAGMLSIPRDTLVRIPDRGSDKVNAAYPYGGPDIARRTVSQLLGVPIHAYVIVDFIGFRRILNAVDGVIVDTPLPVRDNAYPTDDFGVTRVDIRAGPQHLDSETALRYARSRHGSNDFSRAERQQRVLNALKRRLGEQSTVLQLPSLVDELSGAVRTDLDPGNALPLIRLALGIDSRDIDRRVLTPTTTDPAGQLREINSPAGYYLEPIRPALAVLVAELFYDPRVRAEAATVELRAPSSKLGDSLRDDLEQRGYRVARVTTTAAQRSTTVVLRNGAKRYSAEQLAKALGGTMTRSGADSDADIVVLLGDDFRGLAIDAR